MKRFIFRLKKWFLGFGNIRQCDNLMISKSIIDRLTEREYISVLKMLENLFGRHMDGMGKSRIFKKYIDEYRNFESRVIFIVEEGSQLRIQRINGGFYFIYIGLDMKHYHRIVTIFLNLFIEYRQIGYYEKKQIVYFYSNLSVTDV